MPVSFDGKLVVAISSRALFNLADSHRVYLEEGLEAFQDYQTRHEDDVLEPGDAFPLVQKLLAINELKEGKGRV
ncbi:MAG: 5'-nucleotidase, partial [Pseudomonadota bacterium]|nr:5'-nucleotidase [Pseudomonadota bacterium]MEE3387727.1 5'-nucleotidase [Pseudomonadota bacterium]